MRNKQIVDELTKILNSIESVNDGTIAYNKIQSLKISIETERLKEREILEDNIHELVNEVDCGLSESSQTFEIQTIAERNY